MSGNSKYTATVSLGVMAAGFVGSLFIEGTPWVRFIQSGFEAGLVGGLADWFAVTALFRHPLGIPIPHTALLPKNRDKVSKALVTTIQEDLLSKQSIMDKLAQVPLVAKLLRGTEEQLSKESAQAGIAALSEYVIRQIPLEKAAAFAEAELRKLIENVDTRKALDSVLEQVYSRQYDEKAFDFVLDLAEQLVSKDEIRNRIGLMAAQALMNLNAGGLMQFALNAFVGYFNEEKLGSMIQQFMLTGIEGLRQEDNINRRTAMGTLRHWLNNPEHRERIAAELEGWKGQLLTQWNLGEQLLKLLQRLQEQALAWVSEPDFTARVVFPFLSGIIRRIEGDTELMNKLEHGLREQIVRWIESNHHKIGTLIKENIDRYDNETLISLMEDKIGKDLQWIRVNGAVCGFLIGLVLAGIKMLA